MSTGGFELIGVRGRAFRLVSLRGILSISRYYTDALGGDAEAGAVHEGIRRGSGCIILVAVGPLPFTAAACSFISGSGRSLYEFDKAGWFRGRTFDAHLVLDTAYGDTTVTLVVDEHGKTASVFGAFFRAGEHEVDVAVAVGDEAFHTVEYPCSVGLLGCLEHYALEVGAASRAR